MYVLSKFFFLYIYNYFINDILKLAYLMPIYIKYLFGIFFFIDLKSIIHSVIKSHFKNYNVSFQISNPLLKLFLLNKFSKILLNYKLTNMN